MEKHWNYDLKFVKKPEWARIKHVRQSEAKPQ